ncbi:hypothetical protein [Pseudoalteromonas phage vB_Pun_Y3]
MATLKATYTISKNGINIAKAGNLIHTSYFSRDPQSNYRVQFGSSSQQLDFTATALASFKLNVGGVEHHNLNRKVSQHDRWVAYEFAATWAAIGSAYSGDIAEVGICYSTSATAPYMISRATFKDPEGAPMSIQVTQDDTLGATVAIEIKKQIIAKPVSFTVVGDKLHTGLLHDVNLGKWFESNLATPLPSTVGMALFNSPDLAINHEELNALTGGITPSRVVNTAKSKSSSYNSRADKYSAYFPPGGDYSFNYIGLYNGSSSLAKDYVAVIALSEELTITDEEEFTIAITFEQTEVGINGNTK